jgi:hypothetical protein
MLTARRKLITRYMARERPRDSPGRHSRCRYFLERHLCKRGKSNISREKKRPSVTKQFLPPSWPSLGHLLPRSLSDRGTYFFRNRGFHSPHGALPFRSSRVRVVSRNDERKRERARSPALSRFVRLFTRLCRNTDVGPMTNRPTE